MVSLLNYRLRVTLMDSRQITGQFLAFDQHMNMVLSDAEEFRRIKRRKIADGSTAAAAAAADERRTLGLIILRGEHVVSISVEGPPPADVRERVFNTQTNSAGPTPGPGIARPIQRGLAGPVRGVGSV